MADVYDAKTNKPRPDVLKQHFVGEGGLKLDVAMRIIADGAAVFKQEKCLLEIPQPITGSVCFASFLLADIANRMNYIEMNFPLC